jgi:hypothetical protein
MTTTDDLDWKLSRAAIAEAEAVIEALSPIEPDLSVVRSSLQSFPLQSFTPDRLALAWRGLYLSIYQLPRRIMLVGSIDDAPELAGLAEDTDGLLIVETDAQLVSIGELLPHGTQWRSLTEFGADLDAEDRVYLATALVNGLQPTALLVMGSRAGWEMLARHGGALGSNTLLSATTAASPDLSAANLLGLYLRKCMPMLSVLYGPNEQSLRRIAALFGLTPGERKRLREFRGWQDGHDFLSSFEGKHD